MAHRSTIPRLLIAAPKSGSGKTTVVCALLQALKKRGLSLTAFKSGPDYIDPMFHRRVLHTPSYNLDLFLFGRGEKRSPSGPAASLPSRRKVRPGPHRRGHGLLRRCRNGSRSQCL